MTASLFVLTLLRRNWTEANFGVQPDGGSGPLEWAIAGVLLFATLTFALVCQAARARATAAATPDGT